MGLGPGEHWQQPQRRGVGPLEVVEEEHQRRLAGGDGLYEELEREGKPGVGLHASPRHCLPEQLDELRQEREYAARRRAEGLPDPNPPGVDDGWWLAPEAAHEIAH